MDEVFRMYAMSDGDPLGEPQELDPDHDEDFDEEDEEVETSTVLTSSDDDEGVIEEAIIIIVEEPEVAPVKKAAAKKAAKKAPAKKAAKKAPAKGAKKVAEPIEGADVVCTYSKRIGDAPPPPTSETHGPVVEKKGGKKELQPA